MRLGETQSILLPKGALASGWLLRAWASKALKPSRDGGSTTTQGELSGLFMEKFLPILTLNLSHSNFRRLLLAFPSYITVRSPTPSLPRPFGGAGGC